MKTFEIYRNYGCLAAEKSIVYTYGMEAETAVCSDTITVQTPAEWEVYETTNGALNCEAPWGWKYNINELLCGNEYPYFSVIDKNGKNNLIKLEIIE